MHAAKRLLLHENLSNGSFRERLHPRKIYPLYGGTSFCTLSTALFMLSTCRLSKAFSSSRLELDCRSLRNFASISAMDHMMLSHDLSHGIRTSVVFEKLV